jgi:hypothetical protein
MFLTNKQTNNDKNKQKSITEMYTCKARYNMHTYLTQWILLNYDILNFICKCTADILQNSIFTNFDAATECASSKNT